jgi:hypothetical protein
MSKHGLASDANVIVTQVEDKNKSYSVNNNQALQQEDDSQYEQLNLLDTPKVILFYCSFKS